MMQQRSTGQRSAVDLRRRQTNIKLLVSQSMSAVLRQLYNYCQMLNQLPKVSSGTCQQFVEDAVKISNIFGFSTFTCNTLV